MYEPETEEEEERRKEQYERDIAEGDPQSGWVWDGENNWEDW